MLTIRADQMTAFGDLALRRFERELLLHLSRQAPEHCRAIGEASALEAIQLGIRRASVYGLTNRGPVRTYVELMFLLGSYFDTDPQYPWATAALIRDDMSCQMDRAGRLFDAATAYFDQAFGEDGQVALRALRVLIDLVREPPPLKPSRIDDDLLQSFHFVYPEKCARLGDGPLIRLIDTSLRAAARHEFNAAREIALVAGLMFALGHGCLDDPLFPWISRTLEDPRIKNSPARAARLERRMLNYSRYVLDRAER